MGDADDRYDFLEVPQFERKLREGYDLAIGKRFRGHQAGRDALVAQIFRQSGPNDLNLFFRTGIGDSYCGMRGFSREIYDKLDVRSTGTEFGPELIGGRVNDVGRRIAGLRLPLFDPDQVIWKLQATILHGGNDLVLRLGYTSAKLTRSRL